MTLTFAKFEHDFENLSSKRGMLKTAPGIEETARANPGTKRDTILSSLEDQNRDIPERELATILDAFRHDRKIHRTLIARPHLPASIVDRLVRLVARDTELNDLLQRHAVPESFPADLRSVRSRPHWW